MSDNTDNYRHYAETIAKLLHVISQGNFNTKGADFEAVGTVIRDARILVEELLSEAEGDK
jgi:hypothetical protein